MRGPVESRIIMYQYDRKSRQEFRNDKHNGATERTVQQPGGMTVPFPSGARSVESFPSRNRSSATTPTATWSVAQSQGVPLEIFTNAALPSIGQLRNWVQRAASDNFAAMRTVFGDKDLDAEMCSIVFCRGMIWTKSRSCSWPWHRSGARN
jgi:hypothetical protein